MMPVYVPNLSDAQIADAAASCLARAHPDGSIPVPIEDIIDVGYRIDLVPLPYLEERFGTIAFITRDLKEIRVDDYTYRHQPYRLRFSLAHELAHLILHPTVYQALVFASPAEWKAAMASIPTADYRRMEDQADQFAGMLIVPRAQFRQSFQQIAAALSRSNTSFRELPKNSQDYAVRGLAKQFGVSSGTIWFRLRDEGLI